MSKSAGEEQNHGVGDSQGQDIGVRCAAQGVAAVLGNRLSRQQPDRARPVTGLIEQKAPVGIGRAVGIGVAGDEVALQLVKNALGPRRVGRVVAGIDMRDSGAWIGERHSRAGRGQLREPVPQMPGEAGSGRPLIVVLVREGAVLWRQRERIAARMRFVAARVALREVRLGKLYRTRGYPQCGRKLLSVRRVPGCRGVIRQLGEVPLRGAGGQAQTHGGLRVEQGSQIHPVGGGPQGGLRAKLQDDASCVRHGDSLIGLAAFCWFLDPKGKGRWRAGRLPPILAMNAVQRQTGDRAIGGRPFPAYPT